MLIGLTSAGWIWLSNAIYLIGASIYFDKSAMPIGNFFLSAKILLFPFFYLYAIGLGGGLPALGLTTIGLPLASIIINEFKGSSNNAFNPDAD